MFALAPTKYKHVGPRKIPFGSGDVSQFEEDNRILIGPDYKDQLEAL